MASVGYFSLSIVFGTFHATCKEKRLSYNANTNSTNTFQVMKKNLIAALYCAFAIFLSQPVFAGRPGCDPTVKAIFSAKRIWLVTDEMPVKKLTVQVFDANGKVVLEQHFSSKTANWSLDVETLPAGRYSLQVGTDAPINFKK